MLQNLDEASKYAKTIPTSGNSDRAMLMKPQFKKGSPGKLLLNLLNTGNGHNK